MSDQTCARLGQVNDGDLHVDGSTDIGEGGQKGWSGWGPYAVMYGKTPEQAGLVTLQAMQLVTQLVTQPRPTRATSRLIIDARDEGQILTDLPFFMGSQIKRRSFAEFA